MNNALLMTIGRTLLGLYFLVPGVMKFVAWDMHIEMMVHHGVPGPAPLLLIRMSGSGHAASSCARPA